MKIVITDGYTLNPGDLDWAPFHQIGSVEIFERTSQELLIQRIKDANIVVSNKSRLTAEVIQQLDQLQCICVSATGYNNVDVEAAAKKNIPVCNVLGYSSPSVAQHVFAFILNFSNHLAMHHQSVQQGDWSNNADWCYWKKPIIELAGKTLGIYGFGKIGQAVAKLGLAYDMKVIAHHKHPERDRREGVAFVGLEELIKQSDFLTLHAPLNDENKEIVNQDFLSKMKSSAYLINTGRGGLIQELDLKNALEKEIIAGAGLDVLSAEPPAPTHPLLGVKNCWITPHQAWGSRESRQRLLDEVILNIQAFQNGTPRNQVNKTTV